MSVCGSFCLDGVCSSDDDDDDDDDANTDLLLNQKATSNAPDTIDFIAVGFILNSTPTRDVASIYFQSRRRSRKEVAIICAKSFVNGASSIYNPAPTSFRIQSTL